MIRSRAAAALAFMMLAAACSGTGAGDDEPSSAATPGPLSGTIRFMAFGDAEELVAYRRLIEAFEAAEPAVTVEFIETSDRDDLIARLSTSFAGGVPPDLFLMNYRFYGQFYAKDVLEPLQPYLDSSGTFQAEDFYPQAMEALQEEGARSACRRTSPASSCTTTRISSRKQLWPPRNGVGPGTSSSRPHRR